jgi:hypothetical protein
LSLPAKFVLSERESCPTPVATYPYRVRVSLPQFFEILEPSKLKIKPCSKFFENCWVRVQLASEGFIYPSTLNPLLHLVRKREPPNTCSYPFTYF